jgi:outer membrane protein assembly factor BamE (lipoprotein component of BamABCDE complex)
MKILILFLFLFTLNCSTNKVSKNHGFKSLETKFEKIVINQTNKNDIIDLIGPPSTKSDFNKNKWFYIERRKTNQSLIKLGYKKIEKNDILMVEFNNRGILKNKKIFNLKDMNKIKYLKSLTQKEFKQKNFMYNIFSSFREKINAPARNRSKNK